jgi:hypothetical protein
MPREYLDNFRRHGGAFTDGDYESVNEEGFRSADKRIEFHERMKIL